MKIALYSAFLFSLFTFQTLYSQVNQEWVNTFDGGSSSFSRLDQLQDMIIDSNGNIFVTGYSQSNGGGYDLVTIKYNINGTQQWLSRIQPPFSVYSYKPSQMKLDNNGNVIICGSDNSPEGTSKFFILKLNSNGSLSWKYTYIDSTISNDGWAYSLIIDEANNIYANGYIWYNGGYGMLTTKFNTDGSLIWSKRKKINDIVTFGQKIQFDNQNNIICSGYYLDAISIYKLFICGYTSAGDSLFTYKIPETAVYSLYKMHIDSQNNFYLAGPTNTYDGYVIKVNSTGNVIWSKYFANQSSNSGAGFKDFVLDATGNIYVCGGIVKNLNNRQFMFAKYSSDGTLLWDKFIYSSSMYHGDAYSITLKNQSVFVAGYTGILNNQSSTILTIKFSLNGDSIWAKTFAREPLGTSNINRGFKINTYNNKVITAGICRDLNVSESADYCTIAYSDLSLIHNQNSFATNFILNQNYPNPFNPATKISFAIPKSDFVNLKVYDITGKEISSLVNQQLSAGTYEVDFDASHLASGVYHYKLTSANFSEVKKMMLIK